MFVDRFIGDEGLKKISENGTVTDVKELVKRALDVSVYGFFFSSSVVHICVWSMSGPIVPDSIPMEWTHECDVIRPSVAAYCKPQCQ